MAKLLMISGDRSLAQGKRGAFYNTLEEFHKYWERIDIVCPKIQNPKSKIQNLFGNVFIHSSPWPLIFQPFWILKKGRKIYREQKFDLITVHEYPPFYNGLGARMLWSKIHPVKSAGSGAAKQQFDGVKIPYVLEIFHIPGYPKAANLKEKIYRLFFYFFIKLDCQKAMAVRVMNNQVAEKLLDLGLPKPKIKLIPAIYIDLDIFRPMNLEKKYDLIFVGRLAKNKGIELLIDAVKILCFKFAYSAQASAAKAGQVSPASPRLGRGRANSKLLIVGDGPLKKRLKFKVKSLKLENNIIFHGWAENPEEIAKLMNQSKTLVMPSYNEGGPRVIVEAMACGIPILATPVGIVADIIKGGQFGQIIQIIKWNSQNIAQSIYQILSDHSLYQKYSQIGLETMYQFEKKSAIKNYAEKLQELSLT